MSDQQDIFSVWIRENGGDDDILSVLRQHGLCSKLSLRYLNLDSNDGSVLAADLNYGQKCLLQGLIKLVTQAEEKTTVAGSLSGTSCAAYKKGTVSALEMGQAATAPSLREKLGKLFHFNASGTNPGSSHSNTGPSHSIANPGALRSNPGPSHLNPSLSCPSRSSSQLRMHRTAAVRNLLYHSPRLG